MLTIRCVLGGPGITRIGGPNVALTMLALLYILEQQIIHHKDVPLLSANDIKYLLANSLQKKAQSEEELQNIIWQRHRVRQMDINRYYH